jgi:GR25 family glycosyltransferase involved in LPS biosynthesis
MQRPRAAALPALEAAPKTALPRRRPRRRPPLPPPPPLLLLLLLLLLLERSASGCSARWPLRVQHLGRGRLVWPQQERPLQQQERDDGAACEPAREVARALGLAPDGDVVVLDGPRGLVTGYDAQARAVRELGERALAVLAPMDGASWSGMRAAVPVQSATTLPASAVSQARLCIRTYFRVAATSFAAVGPERCVPDEAAVQGGRGAGGAGQQLLQLYLELPCPGDYLYHVALVPRVAGAPALAVTANRTAVLSFPLAELDETAAAEAASRAAETATAAAAAAVTTAVAISTTAATSAGPLFEDAVVIGAEERRDGDGWARIAAQARAAAMDVPALAALRFAPEIRVQGAMEPLIAQGVLAASAAADIAALEAESGRSRVVHGGRLTRGAVGCALSHIRQWREVLASGRARLILEDDVRLSRQLAAGLASAAARLRNAGGAGDWSLLYLGASPMALQPPYSQPLAGGLRRAVSTNYSLFAYVLSPRGARQLLSAAGLLPLAVQLDEFVQTLTSQSPSFRALLVDPPLAFHVNALRATTIQKYV